MDMGFCNRIWREKRWPEKWKEGVIVPIVKTGERKEVEHYRGGINVYIKRDGSSEEIKKRNRRKRIDTAKSNEI